MLYGSLDGYLKAVDAETGAELYRFKTPSGIIGNVNTFMHRGKQYIGVLSGVGGWAGIGLAAGLTEDTAGLGAVGAYRSLSNYTQLGGQLTVFALPDYELEQPQSRKGLDFKNASSPFFFGCGSVEIGMRKSYLAVFVLALVWNAIPSAGAQTQQSEEKPYKIDNGVSAIYVQRLQTISFGMPRLSWPRWSRQLFRSQSRGLPENDDL